MQCINRCDGRCRGHQLWSTSSVITIKVGGIVNAGPFRDALSMFISIHVLSGNKLVVCENKAHVVQTRRHEIQPLSRLPESLQEYCCVGTISCCSDIDYCSSVSVSCRIQTATLREACFLEAGEYDLRLHVPVGSTCKEDCLHQRYLEVGSAVGSVDVKQKTLDHPSSIVNLEVYDNLLAWRLY